MSAELHYESLDGIARRLKARELSAVEATRMGACGVHHPTIVPPVNPWNAGYWTGVSTSC